MKKTLVVIGIMAAVAAVSAISAKGFSFNLSVPSSVSDVANAPADMAYDACKAWAEGHQNNMTYNSANIEKEIKGKDFSGTIYEKDWRKSSDKYDKENQRLEMRSTYNNFAEVKIRCNKEKCDSVYCNKK